MESPLLVVATAITITATGLGGVWAALQAFERIYMLPLNRRKAELDIEKLELEIRNLRTIAQSPEQHLLAREVDRGQFEGERPLPTQSVKQALSRGSSLDYLVPQRDDASRSHHDGPTDGEPVVETVRNRLLRNPIHVEDIEIESAFDLLPPAS